MLLLAASRQRGLVTHTHTYVTLELLSGTDTWGTVPPAHVDPFRRDSGFLRRLQALLGGDGLVNANRLEVVEFFMYGALHPRSWNELLGVFVSIDFLKDERDHMRAAIDHSEGGRPFVVGLLHVLFSNCGDDTCWLIMKKGCPVHGPGHLEVFFGNVRVLGVAGVAHSSENIRDKPKWVKSSLCCSPSKQRLMGMAAAAPL